MNERVEPPGNMAAHGVSRTVTDRRDILKTAAAAGIATTRPARSWQSRGMKIVERTRAGEWKPAVAAESIGACVLDFDEESRRLAAGLHDGSVRVWSID